MTKMIPPVCRALLLLLVLAGAAPQAGAAQQGFRVELGEAQDPESQRVRRYFEENRVFNAPVQGLNAWVRMPRPVTLHATECPAPEVRWVPAEARVEVCYPLLPYLTDVLAADSALGELAPAFYFFVLHGAAHAIVDELDLPAAAGEEQAVDEVMGLMLTRQGGVRGSAMLAGVQTLLRADTAWSEREHAATHALTAERIETMACIAHGANPSRFPEYRQRDLLSAQRAAGCAAAYQRVYDGVGQRLARHMN